jgi:hypothetical protein
MNNKNAHTHYFNTSDSLHTACFRVGKTIVSLILLSKRNRSKTDAYTFKLVYLNRFNLNLLIFELFLISIALEYYLNDSQP